MRDKARVYVEEFGSYGDVSLEELKDDKVATVTVHFYKDRSSKKGDMPRYELTDIKVVKKINLK
jgi:hypothetical protein